MSDPSLRALRVRSISDHPRAMEIEDLRRRRERHRRALRRRRAGAGLALLAFALVAAAVVLLLGSGGASRPTRTAPAASDAAARVKTSAISGVRRTSGGGIATGRPGTQAVPILMYHVIAPPPAGAPFPGLYVDPAEFAAQMKALKRAGWTAVTLDELAAYWHSGISLPHGKPIVVSFDNGYQSQYTRALPVLHRLGWVGDENIQLTGLPPSQGGLGDDEIRGLVKAGWELDTQGISHADLITLDAQQLHEQVASSRATIQRRFHVPVNWFCYPSGHYDASVIAAVKTAGYKGSTTVVPGWAAPSEDPYRLHRLRVLGRTSPAALLALIAATRDDPPAPASYNGT
jgi:peptidoglycan/xylan/chitin deacetylase (PgdA/CDA1 family)